MRLTWSLTAAAAVVHRGAGYVSQRAGEFKLKEFGRWRKFLVKVRMMIAPPCRRVTKGSVYYLKLPGKVAKMEEVAQGRMWTGGDAAPRGLVDAVGGISRAVAIAKQKANIPKDQEVNFTKR